MREVDSQNSLQRMSAGVDRINSRFAATFQAIINKVFQTERFRTTKEAVLAVEGVFLFSVGATLMQIGEWFLAILFFISMGFLLFAKALTLDHWAKKVIGSLAAVILSIFLLAITVLHKPPSDPWSNLQKIRHNSILAEAPAKPLSQPSETISASSLTERPTPPVPRTKVLAHRAASSRSPTNLSATDTAGDPLIERAVRDVQDCYSFENQYTERHKQAIEDVRKHAKIPNESKEEDDTFARWRMTSLNRNEIEQYNKVYKAEIAGVMRDLQLAGAQEEIPQANYDNPISVSDVSLGCTDLKLTSSNYVRSQLSIKKISQSDAKKYLDRLMVGPPPLQSSRELP